MSIMVRWTRVMWQGSNLKDSSSKLRGDFVGRKHCCSPSPLKPLIGIHGNLTQCLLKMFNPHILLLRSINCNLRKRSWSYNHGTKIFPPQSSSLLMLPWSLLLCPSWSLVGDWWTTSLEALVVNCGASYSTWMLWFDTILRATSLF